MVRRSLNKEHIYTYNVADDISIQLVEIPRLKKFPKCTYCRNGNFWNETWSAASVLSKYLATEFPLERVKGCRILVIGCGVGLEGIVLAKLGAIVSFLDHIPDALQLISQNCFLNKIKSFQMICCCWRDLENVQNIGKYDMVIGSDVLYDPQEWIWIKSLLEITLKTKGLALFSDPMRYDVMDFFRDLAKDGFRVKYIHSGWVPSDQWALIYCIERI